MDFGGSAEEASARRAARKIRLNVSATKIQAVVRGHMARKIDYLAMMNAVEWLKENKIIEEGNDPRVELIDASRATAGVRALATAQLRIQIAAIQMQALARGYLCRKFDFEALTDTLEWLREYQKLYAPPEVEVVEPK
jgi:hypothetical protein